MKTQRTKKKRFSTRSLVISAIVLLLLIGGGTYAYHRHNANKPPTGVQSGINYSPPTQAEKQAAEDQKVKAIDQQPSTQQTPTNQSVVISGATQDPTSHDVIVQTQLNGPGWQKCTLTLAKAGSPSVTATADVLYQPSYSTCMGFTVQGSSFLSTGSWTATLTVTNSDGTPVTSSPVNVNVEM